MKGEDLMIQDAIGSAYEDSGMGCAGSKVREVMERLGEARSQTGTHTVAAADEMLQLGNQQLLRICHDSSEGYLS